MRTTAWAALTRQPAVGRLIQLAAASGAAVFQEAEATGTAAAMRWLLDAAVLAEQGLICGEMPHFADNGETR